MTRPLDERARGFLQRQRVAHLATASASGAPHVVPICFALLADTVYIAIDEKPKTSRLSRLRRLRNILENPEVAIVADLYDDADWTKLGFVLLRGKARVITPPSTEHSEAVHALRERYAQYRAMALESRPIIAADITAITSWGRLEP